ncbi:MAG: hypothetical protein JXX29_11300 [Deltaproteobacteria bacterium]|nr:hypothetical protein [Deltaproteobacteria bacterium]MBN2672257.1 hypothetical protein [Deltaproteobacteria bacterium]
MIRRMPNVSLLFVTVLLISITASAGSAKWPKRAERSGLDLPETRSFGVSSYMGGAYIPQIGGKSSGDSLVLAPGVVWNFAFSKKLGLFGMHDLNIFRWANVKMLAMGHEAGVRLRWNEHWSVETAYVTHRTEVLWVDDYKSYPGGVLDHGAEVGTWIQGEPISRFRLSLHVMGRIFSVYTDKQGVLGHEWRMALLPWDGHTLILAVEFFEVWRQDPRAGVDKFTHNTVAHMEWRSQIKNSFGFFISAMVSLNMQVGEVPMLELKRSMIGEPMGLGTVGLFFEL